MEKDQFVIVENQGWWLLEPDLDAVLDERRRTLGECWGWTDLRWYAERLKLEEVYQFLELNRADLLRELDDATEVYKRQKWLDDVITAKRPAQPTHAEEAAPAANKAAEARPAPAPAAKKASAFGRRAPAEGTPADSAPAANPATPAAAGAAAAAEGAQPRKPSPFAKKAAPRTEPAAPVAAAGGAESVEQIRESLSQLAADPNVPVNAQEVEELLKDPNFATNLAQAEAAIEAELEAELAAAESRA
jgi:hypothetical protein